MSIIGFIIPPETQLFSQWAYNYYFTEILRGSIAASDLFNWEIMIFSNRFTEKEEVDEFCTKRQLAGLVLLPPLKNISMFADSGILSIIVNGRYDDIAWIDTDSFRGAYKAVDLLVSKGHKRIAHINGDMTTHNAVSRFEAYKKVLADRSIDLNEDYVKNGDFTEDSGFYSMTELIGLDPRPSAVFCSNDLMAIGALRALSEAKLKVPKDCSIIGFDDLIISKYLSPPLTTVRQQFFHLGKEAVITLISMIRGERGSLQKLEIDTRLIERDSVASI